MKVKRLLQRLTAFLLAVTMSCSILVSPASVFADNEVPGSGITDDGDVIYKSDLQKVQDALHFYIRHWHTVYPAQASLQDIVKDDASGCYFVIVDGYIVNKTTEINGKTIEAGAYLINSKDGNIAVPAEESRYIARADENSVVMIANPVSETGTYGGVSLSAGQSAANITTMNLTPRSEGSDHLRVIEPGEDIDDPEHANTNVLEIKYDGITHLVKGHVFYISKTKESANDEELGESFFDGKPEQDTIVTDDGSKYYDTSVGLHTDKSVSEYVYNKGTENESTDGRTFELELEAWFTEGKAPYVGMILDASGSMAFTSGEPKIINVKEGMSEEDYEKIEDKVGALEKEKEEKFTYDYPQRENLIGYYPVTSWRGDSGNPNDRDHREWRLNVATGNYATGNYASRLTAQVKFEGKYEFVEDTKYNPQGVAGMSFVGDYGIEVGTQINEGENLHGILLDAKPSGTSFTLSFTLNIGNRAANTGNTNTTNIAELLYIGPLSGDTTDTAYYRAYRDSGNNSSHFIGEHNGTEYTNISNAFQRSNRHVITLVFDGETVTSYMDGNIQGTAQSFSFDTEEQIRIVIDGIVDNYDYSGTADRTLIDDIFVYDVALKSDEVRQLYSAYNDDKKADSNEADIDGGNMNGSVNWNEDIFLTAEEVDLILSSHNTDNSRLGAGGYNYFVLGTDYAPLGYWGGVKSGKTAYVTDEEGNRSVIGSFTSNDGNYTKAGWYFVSHAQSAEYYEGKDVQSGKSLRGLYSGNAGGVFTDTIAGEAHNTGFTYTCGTGEPVRFYIDAEGNLRCFYSESSDAKTSYVYFSEDEDYINTEALQRAMGSFMTRLIEKSDTSRVSAVRFSATDETILENKGEKLVILDWTNDPETAQKAMSLKWGDGGTLASTTGKYGLEQYNFGLTGATNTYSGLLAYETHLDKELNEGTGGTDGLDPDAPRYIILFTDGEPSANEQAAIDEAKALMNKNYTIFTVLLTSGSLEYGSETYNNAKNFLVSISGDKDTPDNEREQYFYVTEYEELKARTSGITEDMDKVDLLVAAFTRDILERITEDLTEYIIQDYIDPRFDLVDAEGNVLHLNAGGKVYYNDENEPRYTVNDESEQVIKLYNIDDSDNNISGISAYLRYDSKKDMYYLVWVDQSIPSCMVSAKKLTVWNAKIVVKAKDDLIGGNAILTNGNAEKENFVYSEGSQGKQSSGTGRADRTDRDDKTDIYVSKGFPRTTVNVGPIENSDNGTSLIYMGQELSEKSAINLLLRDARDKNTAEYLYWEYLYRYWKYYNSNLNEYNLPKPEIIITDNSNVTSGDTISAAKLLQVDLRNLNSVINPNAIAVKSIGTVYTGTINGDTISIDQLIQAALGNLGKIENLSVVDGNGDPFDIASLGEDIKVVLQLPYAYLPDVVVSITDDGKVKTVDDIEDVDVPNSTGEKEHKVDILGYLTYTVNTLTGDGYAEYPEEGQVTTDTLKRGSYLEAAYSPLPIYDQNAATDRSRENGDLITEADNNSKVYGWNYSDGDAETQNKLTGDDLNNSDAYSDDDFNFEHSHETIIVSGDIVMQMRIDSDLAAKLADGDTITYTNELFCDGEPVGTFTLTYTKGDSTTVNALIESEYGLPLGTYTFGAGKLSSNSTLKLELDELAILTELNGLFNDSNANRPLDDKGNKMADGDLLAESSGRSIVLGYITTDDGSSMPYGLFGGAFVTVRESESESGDLRISKTVEHAHGDKLPDDDAEFSFNVVLTYTGEQPEAIDNVAWTETETDSGVWTWTGTITLKNGEDKYFKDLPAGTEYTVTETVPEGGNYTIKSINNVEDDSTTSANGEIEASTTDQAAFVNLYTPKPGKLSIPVEKTLNGADMLDSSVSFEFTIEAADEYTPLPDDTSLELTFDKDTESPQSGRFGEITFDRAGTYTYTITEKSDPVDGVVYDETLTHTVTVTVKDVDGTLTVTEINGEPVPETGMDPISFTNYYRDEAFKLEGTKTVTGPLNLRKDADGNDADSETFKFEVSLESAPEGATFKDGEGKDVYPKEVSIEVKAEGSSYVGSGVFIDDTYYVAGPYIYKISEEKPSSNGFDNYDKTEYTVTVTVDEDEDTHTFTIYSEITADGKTYTEKDIAFANPYEPKSASATVEVNKTIDGDPLPDDYEYSFEFTIVELDESGKEKDGSSKKVSITNDDVTKSKSFPKITFTEAGEYTYKVTETDVDGEGFGENSTVHTIKIKVEDIDGELKITSYTVDNGDPIAQNAVNSTISVGFTNTYSYGGPISVQFGGTKKLDGRTWNDDIDKYQIKIESESNSNGGTAPLPEETTVSVGSNKTFAFGAISFDKPGTYEYTVSEVVPDTGKVDKVEYSTVVYKVTVIVTDVGGGLSASFSVNDGETEGNVVNGKLMYADGAESKEFSFDFTNVYRPQSKDYTLTGSKTLTVINGDENVVPFTFKFSVIEVDEDGKPLADAEAAEISVTLPDSGKLSADVTFLNKTYNAEGPHYYKITEIEPAEGDVSFYTGMTYDKAVYMVTVDVTYNSVKGEYEVSETIEKKASEDEDYEEANAVAFSNSYVPNSANADLKLNKTLTTPGGVSVDFGNGAQSGVGSFTFTAEIKNSNGSETTYAGWVDEQSEELKQSKEFTTTGGTDGQGTLTVSGITFTRAGIYKLTVTENTPADSHVANNSKTVTVTYVVSDHNGELEIDSITYGTDITVNNGTVPDDDTQEAIDDYLTFCNTYNPDSEKDAPSVGKVLSNTYSNANMLAKDAYPNGETNPYDGAFSFTIDLADASEQPSDYDADGIEFTSNTKPNNLGTVTFNEIEFKKEGSYTFVITENEANIPQVTCDTHVIYVTYTVTADKNGKLTATPAYTVKDKDGNEVAEAAIEFVNLYGPEPCILTVTKTVDGDYVHTDKEFKFKVILKDSNDDPITGDFKYVRGSASDPVSALAVGDEDKLHFNENGESEVFVLTHEQSITIEGIPIGTTYTVVEVGDDGNTISVNGNEIDGYKLTSVTNNGTGTFVKQNDSVTIEFVNTYSLEPKTVDSLSLTKRIDGRGVKALQDKEFSFTATIASVDDSPADGARLVTVTDGEEELVTSKTVDNVADGSIAIGTIKFTKAGTYTVTVAENGEGSKGITNDKDPIVITYVIEDDEKGNLVIADGYPTYKDNKTEFVNTYNAKPTETAAEVELTKKVEGNPPAETYYFSVKRIDHPKGVTGSFDKTASVSLVAGAESGTTKITLETYSAAGDYVYEVKETAGNTFGMTYDGTVYTVTVNVVDNGEGQLAVNNVAVTKGDAGAELEFTNSYKTGGLTISKTVDGEGADQSKDFTFTVTLTDDKGNPLSGEYSYSGSKTGTIKSGETVKLKHGESITITGLPEGTVYTVEESDNDGYEVSVKVNEKSEDEATATGTISDGRPDTVEFTNSKIQEPKSGDLTVYMYVVDENGDLVADDTTEFTYTVELSDKTINGTFGDMTFTNGVAVLSVFDMPQNSDLDMEFEDGVASFNLSHGMRATAYGLRAGIEYTVTCDEITDKNYSLKSSDGEKGTIKEDEISAAEFIFTFTPPPQPTGSLTVSKTVTGLAADYDKPFTFTVELTDINGNPLSESYPYSGSKSGEIAHNGTVTLKHGESITITGLPEGTSYKVTESDNDGYEVTPSGDEGTIPANGTATALFINNKDYPLPGNLEISKTVAGNAGDWNKEFSFEVELDDSTISGIYGDVTFTNGFAEFTLKHGESVTITGLPEDTHYTVTESDNEGYVVDSSGEEGTIPAKDTAYVTFTNTRNVPPEGTLTVTKNVTGNASSKTDRFKFEITLSYDEDGADPAINITGTYGEIEFTEGVATVYLSHGQSATASDLPLGVYYSVDETERLDYTLKSNNGARGLISEDIAAAVFVNDKSTPQEPTGYLTISKTVTGLTADYDKPFTFTVELTDINGNPLSESYPYSGSKSGEIAHNGTVTLKHGESITIADLPDGTNYTVTESDNEGYDVTVVGNDTGVITNNTTSSAAFINNKTESTPPATGSLSIRKSVSGNDTDPNDEFEFTVTLLDRNRDPLTENYPVTYSNGGSGIISNGGKIYLKAGESATITELPEGTIYSVSETDSKGYNLTYATDTSGTISKEGSVATFINTKNKTDDNTPPAPPPQGAGVGDLSITKSVISGEFDREFEFIVMLTDAYGNNLSGSYRYGGSSSGYITSGGTITLKHGDKITIYDLPEGTRYNVIELTPDDYYVITEGTNGIISRYGESLASFANYQEIDRPTQGTDNAVDTSDGKTADDDPNPQTGRLYGAAPFAALAVACMFAIISVKQRKNRRA